MVRGGKKEAEKKEAAAAEANPEAEERKRRKRMAFSKGILSEAPAKASTAALLSPSKTVTKHHGKDILRKSQRKNRFLFSFPGLLAPLSGGKIGELKDLGTKNPILYLHFSQGQMKLFGTIVYPKNRYLTLQFSRGGKNVTCEDYFDTMIVFSEAWWIGRKEENPEEARLELPRELSEAHDEGYDFKGGAGTPSESKQGVKNVGLKYAEQESPKTDLEDDFSDSPNNFEDFTEVTPVRHSERTAGKRFKQSVNFCQSSLFADAVRFPLSPTGGEAEVALGATKPKPWPIDGAEVAVSGGGDKTYIEQRDAKRWGPVDMVGLGATKPNPRPNDCFDMVRLGCFSHWRGVGARGYGGSERIRWLEPSSAEDLVGDDDDTSKREEQEGGTESIGQELQGGMDLLRDYAPGDILLCFLRLIALFTTVHSCLLIVDHDNEDAAASTHFSGKVQPSARSVIKQKEPSRSSHSCLVQPTISTLFKKVEEKKAPRKVRKSPSSKASSQNLQHVGPEKETNEVEDDRLLKKVKVIDDRKAGRLKMMTSKNFQARQRIVMEAMKIGLVKIAEKSIEIVGDVTKEGPS
ncbi:hypothetical protein RHSIM_Rhsim08G0124800 [Rhododendron simsii]|uniref:DNA-binding protein RHL1 n=1 Tax=Rhododendron simsii TaxID=118357 RepID=A0A834GHV8_RHOSS|nr:hypothetical protein RHSIM_Rhsim08G0124800 [Rhododendron simsii]